MTRHCARCGGERLSTVPVLSDAERGDLLLDMGGFTTHLARVQIVGYSRSTVSKTGEDEVTLTLRCVDAAPIDNVPLTPTKLEVASALDELREATKR